MRLLILVVTLMEDANIKTMIAYDRLEFMGDAVLGYVTADLAFKLHPEMEEGKLTKLRSNIVQRSSLANYAKSIHLESYIHANKSFTQDSLRESDKILEDVFPLRLLSRISTRPRPALAATTTASWSMRPTRGPSAVQATGIIGKRRPATPSWAERPAD